MPIVEFSGPITWLFIGYSSHSRPWTTEKIEALDLKNKMGKLNAHVFTANLCCTLFLCSLFDTGLFHSRVEHWRIPLRPAPTPDCQFNFKLVCRFCCLYLLYLPKPTTRTNSFLSLQVSWDNLYVQKRCYYTRTD